ncbi:hypothetical protein [Pseudomonas triclosanedens]|uniref:hypothetical protein n=1 Tax=Pseudomonas triclosanedens TaxID=2961893 RepID=UPI0020C51D08|nr:hypothetical protein [Pseudomonas triclosanedens]
MLAIVGRADACLGSYGAGFYCFGLGISAPLWRTHGLPVSPPRATHFGKRPKVGKGLAPIIRFFAWGEKYPR